MRLCVFSKLLKDKTLRELAVIARREGFAGYDMCVRAGYPVSPENIGTRLREAVEIFNGEGVEICMITGEGGLLLPEDRTARPLLKAMGENGIRLLKLGYFRFDPEKDNYWALVSEAKKALGGWELLGREYGVKVCYHTHSDRCLGLNCSSLMHLLDGFDPAFIGAYIDPCHLLIEGEDFPSGLAMVRDYLAIVSLKDVMLERGQEKNHGRMTRAVVPAGKGMVNWTSVFSSLKRISFDGPLSVHCEFKLDGADFDETFREEIRFFKGFLS